LINEFLAIHSRSRPLCHVLDHQPRLLLSYAIQVSAHKLLRPT